jgi:hypothetical protein
LKPNFQALSHIFFFFFFKVCAAFSKLFKILSINELQFLLLPCSSGTKTSLPNSSKSNNNRFFKASPKSIKSELTQNLLKTETFSQNFGLLKVKKSISSYYSSSSSTLQQFPILSIPQPPRLLQNFFFFFPLSLSCLTFELRDPSSDVLRKMEKILLQQTEETQE